MPEPKKGGFHALEERIHEMHEHPENPSERKAAGDAPKDASRGEPKEKPAPKK